jgi:polar amino acid transport system substrate-binding protein
MATSRRPLRAIAVLGFVALLAACTSANSPSPSVNALATTSAAPSQQACATDTLATKTAGTLTIGTDNPAFPPYFDPPATGETATDPWELGDPTNGRGFESAVAYALADELGFTKDMVAWIVVPFDSSFAPGPKAFDVYLAQVSYDAERAQNADLSDGYYFSNQALVARKGTPIATAKTIADVAKYRLGAATNTTSLTYINEQIHPTTEARVYNDNDAAIAGLKGDQIDGILVDLPTAFFITAVQMDDGVIVGQFPPVGGEQEHFSFVLELHSPLTDCVDTAIAALKANGSLDAITKEWMSDKADAPLIGQ